MATVVSQVTRTIMITARAVGVDQTTASLNKLAAAEGNVVVAQESVSKSTLSMQSRLAGLQRQLDVNYRAQDGLAKATRTLSGARAQGLVDAAEEARLLDLAKVKYSNMVPAVESLTKSYSLNRMQMMELTHSGRSMFDMLVAGQSPLRALELESMRLGQALSSGSGGLLGGLRAIAPIAVPLIAIITTLGVSFEAFVNKLNAGKPKALSFFDALKGTAITAGDAIKKEFEGIEVPISKVWDWLGSKAGDAINNIIQQLAILAAQVRESFQELPADVMSGIQGAANTIIDWLNKLTDGVNGLGRAIARLSGQTVTDPTQAQINATHIQPLGFGDKANGDIGKMQADLKKEIDKIQATNYLSQIYKNGLPSDSSKGGGKVSDYQKVTDALNLQLKALTETDRQKEIDDALSRAHVSASSKEGQAIADLAGKYYDQKKALDAINQSEAFFAQTVETAFEGMITGGQSLTDVLGNVVKALEAAVLQAALLGTGPLAGLMGTAPTTAGGTGGIFGAIFGSLFSGGASGYSGAEAAGTGSSYATGGVPPGGLSAYSNSIVSTPTPFRFASGAGLMGEAGPEAIMPLKRGADGRLGVAAANSNEGLTVNVQIIRQPGSGEDRATVTRNGNKLDVKAFIKDTAAESAAQPGGTVNRAIRLGLGGKQTLTGRGQ